MKRFQPSIFFLILMLLSIMEFSFAADTITKAESIGDGETLVSSSQSFELGFFSPGNSKYKYLGIWYKIIPQTIVWVANRNNPISDEHGVLTFNSDGNLVLLDAQNSTLWYSDVSRKVENPVAKLLDSGNFVVTDNKTSQPDESYLWQSFDYPSDTLLPGMKLGKNLKTGKEWFLTSWKSIDDPAQGNFTFRLNIQDLPFFVINKGSEKVFRSGTWSGHSFGGPLVSPNMVFLATVEQNEDEVYYWYEPFNNPIIMQLTLNQSGFVLRVIWNERRKEWDKVYFDPDDQCSQYNRCGPNGICSINKTPICENLKDFRAEAEGDRFIKLVRMKPPELINFKFNKSMKLKQCEMECLRNSSCNAYASANLDEQDNGCLMWYGDLLDMMDQSRELNASDVYVKVPSSGLVHASNDKKRLRIIRIVSVISGMVVLGLVFCLILRKRWKKVSAYTSDEKKKTKITILLSVIPGMIPLAALICYIMKKIWRSGQESCKENVEVPLFDLVSIDGATNSFSQQNLIGTGGFGPVYKGILPTGKEIAVKRLSKNSGQGAEEFRNEVVLIAKLQHRNLVGLYGSCIHGEERLLVYEYMPNKSLDHFIFDQDRRALLTWPKQFDIIVQIARGLLYLHEDSKLQIIHRDLKASNILLDSNMNPKISDFGLARIFEGDDIVSETKRVIGTFGYMSPEYAVKGKFSVKSDVFSFGVLLLEIISGQKNANFCHPDHHHTLLGHAWLLWNEGRAMELVDACLEDSIVESQVLRCIQVGLLCVQNCPKDRPRMSHVNFMLANEEASLPHPKMPGFFTETSSNTSTATKKAELHTVNEVTITMVEGR